MFIETERLRLQPLTEAQLRLYVLNDGSLERELGVGCCPKEMDPDLLDALENYFLRLVPLHPERYYFYTLWSIFLKAEQILVGDLCLKGEPDEEGTVEIGYGTYPAYQGQGIMTEAVGGLINWCTARPEIRQLIAETEPGNFPSERLLTRHHFQVMSLTIDNTWWKRNLLND